MDFSIPKPTQELLTRIGEFVEREIYPLEVASSHKSFRQMLPTLQKKRDLVKKMGLWMPQIPKKHGGVGLGFMEHAMVSEVLARSPYGHYAFNAQAPDAGNMEILMEYGTPPQKEKWLEPLLLDDRKGLSRFEPGLDGNDRCP